MFTTQEIFLDLPSAGGLHWLLHLKPAARKLLRLPGLSPLLPIARRVAAIAAPAGRLLFRSHPARPAAGTEPTMTILNANLWHDWPRHRRLGRRLEAVAQIIEAEGVDVALLQEVSRTPHLRADEWLAERLGMAYVYSRANGHETAGFEEGLAILSRYPLQAPSLVELRPGTPFTRRFGLGAQVKTQWGKLQAFSVHLALIPGQNALQVAHLRQWVAAATGSTPALIGGDFNTHEDSIQISQTQGAWIDTYRHLHPHGQGITHEFRLPWGIWRRRRLDYLFLKPGDGRWQVLDARHLQTSGEPHSDHRAVLTRMRLTKGAP